MGNSAKKANQESASKQRTERLMQLTDVIGELFGNRNECIEACALLAATAERLGLAVDPRAVSLLALAPDGSCAAIGVEGAAQGRLAGATVPSDAPMLATDETQFERAGHMVVTSKNPPMILDPTFRQLAPSGLPDIVTGGAVASVTPEFGRVTMHLPAGVGAGEVTYFFDDGNTGWQEGFAHAKQSWAASGVPSAVASHVAAGGWGNSLPFALPWDQHPGH